MKSKRIKRIVGGTLLASIFGVIFCMQVAQSNLWVTVGVWLLAMATTGLIIFALWLLLGNE